MQRAAQRAIRDEAARERGGVVGTGRAHGEKVGAAPNEDDGFSARVSEERNALPEVRARNAYPEVRPLKLAFVVRQDEKYYPKGQSGRNSRVRLRFASPPTNTLSSIRMPPDGMRRSTRVQSNAARWGPSRKGSRSIGMK